MGYWEYLKQIELSTLPAVGIDHWNTCSGIPGREATQIKADIF